MGNNNQNKKNNIEAEETIRISFFESKKFRLVVNVLNICLIVFLVGLIAYRQTIKPKEITAGTSQAEIISADEAVKQAQGTMTSVYLSLIRGETGEYNGHKLKFGYNSDYSGYFDKDNTDVQGYNYNLTSPSEDDENKGYVANVIIYKDGNSSQSVQYKLQFDEEQNLILYHPDSKVSIKLVD